MLVIYEKDYRLCEFCSETCREAAHTIFASGVLFTLFVAPDERNDHPQKS